MRLTLTEAIGDQRGHLWVCAESQFPIRPASSTGVSLTSRRPRDRGSWSATSAGA